MQFPPPLPPQQLLARDLARGLARDGLLPLDPLRAP
jgi:hypothetical protein